MLIYYRGNDIIQAIHAVDISKVSPIGNCSLYDLVEAVENKPLCRDIKYTVGKVDINGLNKYYIDDDIDLAVRDNWVADEPEDYSA